MDTRESDAFLSLLQICTKFKLGPAMTPRAHGSSRASSTLQITLGELDASTDLLQCRHQVLFRCTTWIEEDKCNRPCLAKMHMYSSSCNMLATEGCLDASGLIPRLVPLAFAKPSTFRGRI